MTYLDRINHLWNLRRNGALRSSDHELCAFLLDAFNRLGWKAQMGQTNAMICGIMGISELTLMRSRDAIKAAGLIDFIPGKKGSPTVYMLTNWATSQADSLSDESAFESANTSAKSGETRIPYQMHSSMKVHSLQHHKSLKSKDKDIAAAARRARGSISDDPPSLTEVKASAANSGIPAEVGEAYWNDRMKTDPPFQYASGQPVGNWKHDLASYWQRWQSNNNRNQAKPNHANNNARTAAAREPLAPGSKW